METKHNISNLTDREFEVLEQVSIGKLNKEIADDLGCEIETIKSHLKNAFPKLKVQNRVEATIRFMEITGKLKTVTEYQSEIHNQLIRNPQSEIRNT